MQVRCSLPHLEALYADDPLWDLSAPRAACEAYIAAGEGIGMHSQKQPARGLAMNVFEQRGMHIALGRAVPTSLLLPLLVPPTVCNELGLDWAAHTLIMRRMKDAIDAAARVRVVALLLRLAVCMTGSLVLQHGALRFVSCC